MCAHIKTVSTKELLHAEIDRVPEAIAREVFDYLGYLQQKSLKEKLGELAIAETSLKKDWLSAEEDEAWRNL